MDRQLAEAMAAQSRAKEAENRAVADMASVEDLLAQLRAAGCIIDEVLDIGADCWVGLDWVDQIGGTAGGNVWHQRPLTLTEKLIGYGCPDNIAEMLSKHQGRPAVDQQIAWWLADHPFDPGRVGY